MKALATEMTENFGKRLEPLGLKVRELTGDTVLSRKEIEGTQVEYFVIYNTNLLTNLIYPRLLENNL